MSKWQQQAIANDSSHIDFIYNQSSTSGLIYNLYADTLLQLNFVPEEVYNASTTFYTESASVSEYGLPLDSSDTSVSTIRTSL